MLGRARECDENRGEMSQTAPLGVLQRKGVVAELEACLRAIAQDEVIARHGRERDGVAVEGGVVVAGAHGVVAVQPRLLGLGRLQRGVRGCSVGSASGTGKGWASWQCWRLSGLPGKRLGGRWAAYRHDEGSEHPLDGQLPFFRATQPPQAAAAPLRRLRGEKLRSR